MVKFTELPFIKRLVGFFKQGTSPRGLAVSVTLGILLGILPVLGVTTWLGTLIGVRFKLNVPLILAVLYLVWPLQIGLFVPFLRFGERLVGVPPFALSFEKMEAAFRADFFAAVGEFGIANLYALAGWAALCIPMSLVLYHLLFYIFRYFFWKKAKPVPSK